MEIITKLGVQNFLYLERTVEKINETITAKCKNCWDFVIFDGLYRMLCNRSWNGQRFVSEKWVGWCVNDEIGNFDRDERLSERLIFTRARDSGQRKLTIFLSESLCILAEHFISVWRTEMKPKWNEGSERLAVAVKVSDFALYKPTDPRVHIPEAP